MAKPDPQLPTEVSPNVGFFDRFAARASDLVSRAWFFVFCVLLIVIWLPSVLILRDPDLWQLIINTVTTIITFLLVALIQNAQRREGFAIQHKLNAIAVALAYVIDEVGDGSPAERKAVADLLASLGLEERESSDPEKR